LFLFMRILIFYLIFLFSTTLPRSGPRVRVSFPAQRRGVPRKNGVPFCFSVEALLASVPFSKMRSSSVAISLVCAKLLCCRLSGLCEAPPWPSLRYMQDALIGRLFFKLSAGITGEPAYMISKLLFYRAPFNKNPVPEIEIRL